MKTTRIELDFPEGKKAVAAVLISPHVAAHQDPDKKRSYWRVSDPVSGRRYPLPPFRTRAAAVAWAKELVQKFGPDPLEGGVVKKGVNNAWAKKPKRFEEVREFLRATVFGS